MHGTYSVGQTRLVKTRAACEFDIATASKWVLNKSYKQSYKPKQERCLANEPEMLEAQLISRVWVSSNSVLLPDLFQQMFSAQSVLEELHRVKF